MLEQIVQFLLWVRKRSFFRVVQRTFVMLMPVATIGVYFRVLRDCIFSPDSLIYNIFNFDYMMPDQVWNIGNVLSSGMVRVTLGMFGMYVAYFSAVHTARLYHKDAIMAGIAAVIVITFCAYLSGLDRSSNLQTALYSRILNINGTLIAMVVGYFVGQIFHFFGKNHVHLKTESIDTIRHRAWNSIIPTLISVATGLVLGLLIYFFKIRLLDSFYIKSLVGNLQNSNKLSVVIPITMLATLFWWAGIGYPLSSLLTSSNSGAAIANMNYALRHGNATNVPYKYLGSSLVQAYGWMGDACIALSLTVIVLLFTHNKEIEAIAKLNLLPVAFGAPQGLAVGLPIILNPLYLLPVVCIPAINELIAAAAISLHLIVPSAYPVLRGTPGILIAFFGSNGNWICFIFTILLFILDILILFPSLKIGQKINKELIAYDKQAQISF